MASLSEQLRERKAAAEKLQKLVEGEDRYALTQVLKTEHGRRVLWRVLTKANMSASTFDTEHSVMSLREGRRFMGEEILEDIHQANPEAFYQMQREAEGYDTPAAEKGVN